MQGNRDQVINLMQRNAAGLREGVHQFEKKMPQRGFMSVFKKMQQSLHRIGINTGPPALVEMKGGMLAVFANECLWRFQGTGTFLAEGRLVFLDGILAGCAQLEIVFIRSLELVTRNALGGINKVDEAVAGIDKS